MTAMEYALFNEMLTILRSIRDAPSLTHIKREAIKDGVDPDRAIETIYNSMRQKAELAVKGIRLK